MNTWLENKSKLTTDMIPQHVAIIMDGNGRWAKSQGQERVFGHQHGVSAVRSVIEGAAELGVRYLTLYAFSTENWNRPRAEVDALMTLMVKAIENELDEFIKNNVRLQVIGDVARLPEECRTALQNAISKSASNTGLTVVLALSYSARWEITQMARQVAAAAVGHKLKAEDIDDQTVASLLATRNMPDPDILIRTGGECRVSNFLLWQIAYAELFFVDKMWPDFRKDDLLEIILRYNSRERRFGKTGDQLIAH
ncbi:MAG: isoprenyl transferase [Bacteroidales bacterium]|nr:isoprenyl transferase [Bacteroidales bacterium]